jgi:uncharacterized protein YegJ (DUF2314 family)
MKRLVIGFVLLYCSSTFAQKWVGREPGNETGPVKDMAVYDKAIAPYVAKARASYPAARKRYLAGLPPNHTFYVWTRLYDRHAGRVEDVFIRVAAVKDGLVHGLIANIPDWVTNYRRGERVHFPESEVMNWVIVRPDGTEEGNFVGKFLEHWKPPKA